MRVHRRNYGLRRGLCIVKAAQDSIYKFEGTGCTCARPSVPVETVAEVQQTISTVRPASVRGVSRGLNLPNLSVRKILSSVLNMFPFRFQHVQMFEAGDK